MSVEPKESTNEKLALVHDWLFGLRGGERCLQAFLCLYPQAKIFSLFHQAGKTSKEIDSHFDSASVLNSLPNVRSYYRSLLLLFPFFSSNAKLQGYPLKISLSHAASKNMSGSSKSVRHICYCFTPMRYIWDQAKSYLGWKALFAWPVILLLRLWDRAGARQVTDFVAISRFVAARIRLYYGRRATVIFPPVASSWLEESKLSRPQVIGKDERAFLLAGALVPYKGAELAIRACVHLDLPLWVAGEGPLLKDLQELAKGKQVKFFGALPDAQLGYLMSRCRALVFPCKEDFGILPLEVLAAGRPVIALDSGACKETMHAFRHWQWLQRTKDQQKQHLASSSYTGVFIRPVAQSLQLAEVSKALQIFCEFEGLFTAAACREQAKKFSPASFYDAWHDFSRSQEGFRELQIVDKANFVAEFENLRST